MANETLTLLVRDIGMRGQRGYAIIEALRASATHHGLHDDEPTREISEHESKPRPGNRKPKAESFLTVSIAARADPRRRCRLRNILAPRAQRLAPAWRKRRGHRNAHHCQEQRRREGTQQSRKASSIRSCALSLDPSGCAICCKRADVDRYAYA